MGKLRFYHIQDHYIKFLHKLDSRVQLNKGEKRPYVGVVLELNGFNYYVPLESPKPNHANIKSGGPAMKLDGGRLGLMGFNNMIPVDVCNLIEFDFKKEPDKSYRNLLYNQLAYCEKNIDIIQARAQKTYEKAVSGKVPIYRKVCCDFKKLEGRAKSYKPPKEKAKK